MSTIQIRIDDQTKRDVKKVLDKLGLDMTSAIKIYLKQISEHKAIPFPLVTNNGMTALEEEEILKASRDARRDKNVTAKMSGQEAVDYLKNL